MPPAEREQWIDRAVSYWRKAGFPYTHLAPDEVVREFSLLQRTATTAAFARGRMRTATTGLRLANSFHPQMWHVRSQQHRFAPIDYFNNDNCLRELLRRAIRFWPNRRCWNAQCVRSLFRTYSSGRVANFRPLVARTIIDRFSMPGNNVLDFCAGFGGRLLGSLTLNRHYIGVDASHLQVKGSKNMLKALSKISVGTAEVHHASAEDFLPTLSAASTDLVFSSPPFFDTELYSVDPKQSTQRYPNYRDWAHLFLRVVISEAHRVIRPSGFFVINVADNRRFPLRQDTLRFAIPLFGTPRMIRMTMHSRPLQRSNGSQAFRWEPLFVFKNSPA
jgi:SAM-dependent methyltransferase